MFLCWLSGQLKQPWKCFNRNDWQLWSLMVSSDSSSECPFQMAILSVNPQVSIPCVNSLCQSWVRLTLSAPRVSNGFQWFYVILCNISFHSRRANHFCSKHLNLLLVLAGPIAEFTAVALTRSAYRSLLGPPLWAPLDSLTFLPNISHYFSWAEES